MLKKIKNSFGISCLMAGLSIASINTVKAQSCVAQWYSGSCCGGSGGVLKSTDGSGKMSRLRLECNELQVNFGGYIPYSFTGNSFSTSRNIALNNNMVLFRGENDYNHTISYDYGADGLKFAGYGGFRWAVGLAGNSTVMALNSNGKLVVGQNMTSGGMETYGTNKFSSSTGQYSSHFPFSDNNAYVSGEQLIFRTKTSNTERMRITPNGYIGINTNNPTAQLHVVGNTRLSGDLNVSGSTTFKGAINFDTAANGTVSFNVPQSLNIDLTNVATPGNFKIINSGSPIFYAQGSTGRVGIGTSAPTEKLEVSGKVKATAFVTDAKCFPDYVFAENYDLMSLEKLEDYIAANKRLPGMPSETEVKQNGMVVNQIAVTSVEKIEELTLYIIALQKRLNELEGSVRKMNQAGDKK